MEWLRSSLCFSPCATPLVVLSTLGHGLVESLAPCGLARCGLGRALSCNCPARPDSVAIVTGANRCESAPRACAERSAHTCVTVTNTHND